MEEWIGLLQMREGFKNEPSGDTFPRKSGEIHRGEADLCRDSNCPRVTDEGSHQFGAALGDETDGHGQHDAQSETDSGLHFLCL